MSWFPVVCAVLLSMLGYLLFDSEAVGLGAAVAGFVAGSMLKGHFER